MTHGQLQRALLLTGVMLGLAPYAAHAQGRVGELERRIDALERQVELLQKTVVRLSLEVRRPDIPVALPGSVAEAERWGKLKIGMSEEDVRKLLGTPHRLQTLSSLTYWFYEGGSAYIQPHVSFENHLVYGWSIP